ncbi:MULTISPECIES: hypothetical protein [unclassified Natrinema]|uniref:hypothetical protein n=1 Tax=unclassified Natrinema TaxID=2622230 RepID=UPI00026D4621|nr:MULTISPECIES: hypothetical protein [unclassified Natrinema]AFO56242.1 hypothetical protein NJ7G_0995 [Natrinema sp. J7-2]
MPEMERQDETLSELLVKEAVTRGMESPMRESILEAVEESGGSRSGGRLPLAGALFGLGAAVGFLVGRQSPALEESTIEDLEEPKLIEDVIQTADESTETTPNMTSESEETEDGSRSRLPKLLLAVGAIVGAVVLRRRLSSSEEEEWEPIEEFEPATTGESDDEDEPEAAEGEETDEETEE